MVKALPTPLDVGRDLTIITIPMLLFNVMNTDTCLTLVARVAMMHPSDP